MALTFGAMIAGQIASFAPDYIKAKTSAARIFKLLDREPAIDAYSDSGLKPVSMPDSHATWSCWMIFLDSLVRWSCQIVFIDGVTGWLCQAVFMDDLAN